MTRVAASRRDDRFRPAERANTLSYLEIFRAEPVQRIEMVKKGVGAKLVKRMLTELAIPQSAGLTALNLPPATVNRKVAQDELLAPDQSERVVGMARLIGQLQAMVEDSGDPANFDATAWLSRWLREPLPAFGGAPPFDYMDTMEGQALVSQALGQTQSGAYA